MRNVNELHQSSKQFDLDYLREEYHFSNEQVETWFLGSLMRVKKPQKDFARLTTLHNRITQEDTGFDDRLQSNMRIASQLAEFFPFKWLLEITAAFRKIDSSKLGVKSFEDRICSYLGFIELYLTFRGLTLLDSTLTDINESFDICLTKNVVRSWKMKLLRIIPELREQWVKIREENHQRALLSTVIQVMNKEMELPSLSKREMFQIKQTILQIAREFVFSQKARHIKKPEVWAHAICVKAVREIMSDNSSPFPYLSRKALKVVENKRWQLDQIIQKEK